MRADEHGASASLTGRAFAQYRVFEPIGRGGMGEVYRGFDEKLGRSVAVKALPPAHISDPHARKRFVREVRLASQVVHPYVATVFDVVEQGEILLLVMELVEGRRLDQILREQRPGRDELLGYALEIAEALEAIHGQGLIHRDVKPANVMVTPGGHVKVLDFGLAALAPEPFPSGEATGDPSSGLTGDGAAVGTLAYMSPEQLKSEAVDARSDLFSFGVLLYQSVTGEHPFLRTSHAETISAILNDAPGQGTPAPALAESGRFGDVILRLVEKSPEKRYPSAAAVVADLRAARASGSRALVARPGVASPRQLSQALRRHATPIAAVALATFALTTLAAGYLRYVPSPPISTPAPENAHPVVAVLPFADGAGVPEGGPRGHMVADLVAAGLGDSARLRAIGGDRVDEILSGLTPEAPPAVRAERVAGAARVDWVVTGKLYREGDAYVASVDLRRPGSEAGARTFRVEGDRAVALADRVTERLAQLLQPGTPTPAARRGPEWSDEAALHDERATLALREHRYAEAIAMLEKLIALAPEAPLAHAHLAQALDLAGYGARARTAIARATRLIEEKEAALPPRLVLEIRALDKRIHEDTRGEVVAWRELATARPGDGGVLLDLARALEAEGLNEEALRSLDRVIAIDRLDPRAWLRRGATLAALNRTTLARRALDEAQRLYDMLASDGGRAAAALERGRLEFAASHYVPAGQLYDESQRLYLKAGLEVLAAAAERRAADMLMIRGDFAAARPRHEAALATARAAGDYRLLVDVLMSAGSRLYAGGHFGEAEPLLRQAVDEARKLDNPALLLTPLLNLGSLLGFTGRSDEERPLIAEGLEIARARKDVRSEAQALSVLADMATRSGRFEEARRGYDRVIEIESGPGGSLENLAYAWYALSDLRDSQDQLEEAIRAADRALEIDRQAGLHGDAAYTLVHRSRLRGLLGDAAGAGSDLTEAEAAAKLAGGELEDLVPRLDLARARIAVLQDRCADAAPLLERARAAGVASHAVGLVPVALLELAICANRTGSPAEAEKLGRLALAAAVARPAVAAQARIEIARSLSGRNPAAARTEADEALRAATSVGSPLLVSGALALLVRLDKTDPRALAARGTRELERYLDGAPGGARDAIRRRVDVHAIAEMLQPRERVHPTKEEK